MLHGILSQHENGARAPGKPAYDAEYIHNRLPDCSRRASLGGKARQCALAVARQADRLGCLCADRP